MTVTLSVCFIKKKHGFDYFFVEHIVDFVPLKDDL